MKTEILLYGNTRTCADILYFCGVSVHDDFFCFSLDGKRCALISPLELGRVRRKSCLDGIFDYSEIAASLPKNSEKSYFSAVCRILKSRRVRRLQVPEYFPVSLYAKFVDAGFDMEIVEGEFFAEREVKTESELAEIRKANDVASACFCLVEEILRSSEIRGGKLFRSGEILTSEFLRTEIEKLAVSLGADVLDTVCAAGVQACDPHEVGSGAIAPHSLIVCDIFPRLRSSGYFGDMTRTFLKGEPNPKQVRLVETVLNAQSLAIDAVREGVSGAEVHAKTAEYFESEGYSTKPVKGKWTGFFHSTGHGLGLEVHESPSLGRADCILRRGNVVTVEPGLYYPNIGGCRIEDNVVVDKYGAKMLSNFHYNWVVA